MTNTNESERSLQAIRWSAACCANRIKAGWSYQDAVDDEEYKMSQSEVFSGWDMADISDALVDALSELGLDCP